MLPTDNGMQVHTSAELPLNMLISNGQQTTRAELEEWLDAVLQCPECENNRSPSEYLVHSCREVFQFISHVTDTDFWTNRGLQVTDPNLTQTISYHCLAGFLA